MDPHSQYSINQHLKIGFYPILVPFAKKGNSNNHYITNVLIFWEVAICPSLCNIDLNEVKFGTRYNIRDKEHQPCGNERLENK
jgi:hypothetical protein